MASLQHTQSPQGDREQPEPAPVAPDSGPLLRADFLMKLEQDGSGHATGPRTLETAHAADPRLVRADGVPDVPEAGQVMNRGTPLLSSFATRARTPPSSHQ